MKKLVVAFSGGETSAYMAQWLWNNKRKDYHMRFVFANTGEESEETLEFVEKCSNYFGFPVTWVEAVPRVKLRNTIVEMCDDIFPLSWIGGRIGTTYRKVNFETASRNGEPFERVIQKYGIPNVAVSHCTRELKLNPIKGYIKALGWTDYYTAVGIREDEFDRISTNHKEEQIIYPLIDAKMRPMTKQKINFWWSQQPFRLNLKGYQGNCKWCYKKSFNKLYTIAKENPKAFDFPKRMEQKYEQYIPDTRLELIAERGEQPIYPVRFFREQKTVEDIIEASKTFVGNVDDDAQEFESCEIYSECG